MHLPFKFNTFAVSLTWLIAPVLRANCSLTSIGVTPLPDAGPRFYKGYQNGLYPGGGNSRPPLHDAAALRMAGEVQPLDAEGKPDAANGKVVMISVGMSNTTQVHLQPHPRLH